jgi:hypothetical protein
MIELSNQFIILYKEELRNCNRPYTIAKILKSMRAGCIGHAHMGKRKKNAY